MDTNTQQQIADLSELRATHEKRLRVLVLQSAQLGRNTPAEISIEIREIQEQINGITASMARLQIATSKGIEREIRADSTVDLGDISKQVFDFQESANKEVRQVYELLLRLTDTNDFQRIKRQRFTTVLYFVIIVLLTAILIGIVVK